MYHLISLPVISFAIIFGASNVQSNHAPSSCEMLTFSEDAEGKWEATLNFKVTEQLNGVWIKVDLDGKADVLITDFGETTSTNNRNFVIRRPDLSASPGQDIKAKIIVKYTGVKIAPNISHIIINGKSVCPPEAQDIDTRLQENQNQSKLDEKTCGLVPEAQSLIFNGEFSSEGEWPWHAAIMKINYQTQRFSYICGGSIISENFILTAAHCVTHPRTSVLVGSHGFLIYVGVTRLSNLGIPTVKPNPAEDMFIPSDYNPETYFNDIALIKLGVKLQFSNFIGPVCLWSESTDESSIIGRKGTVVGWGIDHRNQTFSSDLRHAEIPVVSLQTCKNRGEFYRKHTTDKTFCAGGEEDKSVCHGDSGGGMIFRKPGKIGRESVWQIRGVVSVSQKGELHDICNTKGYAIFTDVAKHLNWIKTTANVS